MPKTIEAEIGPASRVIRPVALRTIGRVGAAGRYYHAGAGIARIPAVVIIVVRVVVAVI
jgi:hypothetical protein